MDAANSHSARDLSLRLSWKIREMKTTGKLKVVSGERKRRGKKEGQSQRKCK